MVENCIRKLTLDNGSTIREEAFRFVVILN